MEISCNLRKSIFVFSIYTFFSCTNWETTPNYTELYNLDFKLHTDSSSVFQWRENAAYIQPFSIFLADSLHISRVYTFSELWSAKYDHLIAEFEQRLIMPDYKAKMGRITIESRGKNIETFSLIIDCIDKEEKILISDTIRYLPDSVLTSASIDIPLTNTELLNFKIHVRGKKKEDAYIVFSKLNISMDGRDINFFPHRILSLRNIPKEFIEIDTAIFNSTQGIDNIIREIKKSNIIGLGESTHGSEEIRRFAYQFIINQVRNHDCKYIIIERPIEQTLAYNRYIQDMDFELNRDEINNKSLLDLMDKLRQYNIGKAEKDKVALFGMDYHSLSFKESSIRIFDFLLSLNRQLKLREIDELSILLIEKKPNDVIEYILKHQNKLETFFLRGELDLIVHILRISGAIGDDYTVRFEKRDSIMFENTRFLINSLQDSTSKVIVYGHATHINPVSTFPVVPCLPYGNYMKNRYGENYIPLLLSIGQDRVGAFDAMQNYVYLDLANPCPQSIEFFLISQNESFLYLPIKKELNQLIFSRFKGSHHIKQEFFPINLYQRYRGIFFIKGNTISSDSINMNISLEDKLSNNVFIVRERERAISDIRDRLKKGILLR